jgi:hypothetical protein
MLGLGLPSPVIFYGDALFSSAYSSNSVRRPFVFSYLAFLRAEGMAFAMPFGFSYFNFSKFWGNSLRPDAIRKRFLFNGFQR